MGMALAAFNGTVVAPAATSPATIALDGPAETSVGMPATYTYSTQDANGLVPHSDALFEVRQGDNVVFRTKTHTHTEQQVVTYSFPAPGTYTVRVTNFLSYPSGKEANDFAPSSVERTVMVSAGVGLPAAPSVLMPPTDMNAVAMGTSSEPYTLVGTYDPYTIVGTNTL